ncbi:RCC1-like G exchanging factor-like protein [Apodemus speciosus]|uniref:RCC1-like G exchanging factor-like protein n=1 Tax=Apodemus speciosus TaxID=105296 RepID=A0ABQ0ET74_APOSI
MISSAACGYGFTLLSSRTKDMTKVWGMGLNKDSQLGFHRSRKDKTRGYEYVLEPSPVPLPLDRPQETKVLQVSCGRAHSLVLTDREGVFSMGNNSHGQCGRKVVEDEVYSESHKVHRMQDFDGQVVQVDLKAASPLAEEISRINSAQARTDARTQEQGRKVMAGGCEAAAEGKAPLVQSRRLKVVWGCRKASGRTAPYEAVVCGQDHSLFLTDRGEVYSCGWGADGQTGLGHYNITSTPSKLGGDLAGVTVVQVATYGDCCLALSVDGGVFGWGNSEYLQLASVTDSTQVNVPRCLPFSRVGKVKQVACGGTGCAVLNEEGHVFVWGYGILGKGPKLLETALPEMIPPTLFGLTEFNPEVQVSQIRCGLSHFAALTNKGELFVWGKNLRGCLGIGRLDDQYFPWRRKVTMPGEPVDVACGVDHMVTLAKSFI